MSSLMKSLVFSACLCILVSTAVPTFGAVYIWTDGGADSNWSTGLNWDVGTPPAQPGNWDNDLQFDLADMAHLLVVSFLQVVIIEMTCKRC